MVSYPRSWCSAPPMSSGDRITHTLQFSPFRGGSTVIALSVLCVPINSFFSWCPPPSTARHKLMEECHKSNHTVDFNAGVSVKPESHPLPPFWRRPLCKVDFLRGAAVSEGGKSIITLPSRTRQGAPRIVPHIQEVTNCFGSGPNCLKKTTRHAETSNLPKTMKRTL